MLLFLNTKLLFVFPRLSPKCAKSLLGFPGNRFLEQDIRDGFSGNRPGENCPYGRNFCPYARKPLKHKEGGPMGPSLFYATSNLCFSWDDEKDNKGDDGWRFCRYRRPYQSMPFFTLRLVTRLLKSPALRSGNTSVRW